MTDIAASQIQMVDSDGQNHQVLDMRSTGMYGVTVFQVRVKLFIDVQDSAKKNPSRCAWSHDEKAHSKQ